MTAETPLLEVEGLETTFSTEQGEVVAVDGIDFSVDAGETVCIVGESGSGKTVATESVTRLISTPPGHVDGSVRFQGEELLEMTEEQLRSIRGNNISHIFQNPQDAMNHCYTVGWQIVEALQVHTDLSKADARSKAVDLLDRVGIANASSRFDDYPHEFSGGQKQRVMIAMALVADPDLLIADEPTTALDVTVQSEILNLLDELQDEFGMGILFVTHDLGVVAQIADRVVVMYAGKVMERGDVYDIFDNPSHPYTQKLLDCLPGRNATGGGIPGSLPSVIDPPNGCRFADRCEHAMDACRVGEQPREVDIGSGHAVSCLYYQEGYDRAVVEYDIPETGTSSGEVSPSDD
ncbi:oligopeptide/dipeptide ABC transporter, ATP-binding protein [Halovivax ruber XH-70]|uniref:Nickel import system ATP-binding protein NikD n=1 Tax=Halovivax ruber (strain DSM 18193 / JCM 13892 / XH-70) TaxID=797302 RepID=L0IAD2_HALRX|nr:ABC transporter ATP-binding protein [Halovivax ruber]AGB15694.1 oligopeptide/dipeptide ABC transporter, ATP-binding protein [Halovivax ruber XH-70]